MKECITKQARKMFKHVALQMFHEEENEFSLRVRLQGQTQR